MLEEKTLKEAAYHEAGHAVIWQLNGFWCDEVSIGDSAGIKREEAGYCHIVEPNICYLYSGCYRKHKKQKKIYEIYKERADRWIQGLLAGALSEKKMSKSRTSLYKNGVVAHGGGRDFIEAVNLAKEFYDVSEKGDFIGEVDIYLMLTIDAVEKLLRRKSIWNSVTTLAEALLDKRRIEGDELRKYMEQPVSRL